MKHAAPVPSPHPTQTPLRVTDLDEDVVRTVREMIAVLLTGSGTPTPPETTEIGKPTRETASQNRLRDAFKLTRKWRLLGYAAATSLCFTLPWLIIAVLIGVLAQGNSWWTALLPLFSFVAGWSGVYYVGKKEAAFRKEQALSPTVLLYVLPLLPRENTMETAYCDAVCTLLKPQAAWGQSAVQDILRDLKDLLQTGKLAAARRAEIEQAMNHQSVADGEAEIAHLAERAQAATDPSARETFKQSLALLEARLHRARSLEPLRQQLEAQEEVIQQALAEAQSALSGASLAHWAYAAAGTEPVSSGIGVPLAHLGDTVSRLRGQTESVEQAVREVMAVQTVGGH